eukprot:15284100-Alexandrium_andersonii.AAC.1
MCIRDSQKPARKTRGPSTPNGPNGPLCEILAVGLGHEAASRLISPEASSQRPGFDRNMFLIATGRPRTLSPGDWQA